MRSALIGTLLGGALAVVVVACAASTPHTSATAPQPTTAQATPMPGDKHDQIRQLVNKLDAEREHLQLLPPWPPVSSLTEATASSRPA